MAGDRGTMTMRDAIGRVLPNARPESRRRLETTANVRTFGADEIVFLQGDPIPLTLTLGGYVAFRRTTPDGRELVFAVASPGRLFGLSSIAGGLATIDLVAVTSTEVATWPGDEVRSAVQDDPGFALDVIDGMAKYIVEISGRFDGFIHQDARRRVLRVLAEHEELFFGDPPILSRSHLPGLVGTSREMTGRVVRELERDGIIARVGRRRLRLVSQEALREAVASRGPRIGR
jgi:CRP-like cAMP-binding protein